MFEKISNVLDAVVCTCMSKRFPIEDVSFVSYSIDSNTVGSLLIKTSFYYPKSNVKKIQVTLFMSCSNNSSIVGVNYSARRPWMTSQRWTQKLSALYYSLISGRNDEFTCFSQPLISIVDHFTSTIAQKSL